MRFTVAFTMLVLHYSERCIEGLQSSLKALAT